MFDALATVTDQNQIQDKCTVWLKVRAPTIGNASKEMLEFYLRNANSPKLRKKDITLIGKLVPVLKERDPLIQNLC